MPRRQHPPEIKQQAIELAAGQSSVAAAEQLGVSDRSIRRWLSQEDPANLARYVQEKRSAAQKIVLERVSAATTILMDGLTDPDLNPASAKALQARAVALGILDDHYGGRPTGGPGGTRFGTPGDQLSGWTSDDRVTLERIERLTIQPQELPAQPDQVIDQPASPPGVRKPRGKSEK